LCNVQCFWQWFDPDLLTVWGNQSNLPNPNLFIDPGIAFIWACYGLTRLTKDILQVR
jgi:hypothetical protein